MKFTRNLSLGLTVLTLAAAGCTQGTPGGPGANPPPKTTQTPPATRDTTTVNKPTFGEADQTFSLSVPVLATTVKQGETETVTVGIKRGKNFDQDVTLMVSGTPQGVLVDPANPMIKHGEEEIVLKIAAADDAALGDFTIQLTGQPATGANANVDLKVTVTENK